MAKVVVPGRGDTDALGNRKGLEGSGVVFRTSASGGLVGADRDTLHIRMTGLLPGPDSRPSVLPAKGSASGPRVKLTLGLWPLDFCEK